METKDYIDLELEDGTPLKCEIAESFSYDDGLYVCLSPADKESYPGTTLLMKASVVGEDMYLNTIEDEEEFERVKAFLESRDELP